MIDFLSQPFFNEWLDSFVNPQKRIYWLYLLSAIFIGMIYLYFSSGSFWFSIKKLFSYDSWLSKSARADYIILFLNSFLMIFLSSKLLSKSIVALGIFYTLSDWFTTQAFLQGELSDSQVALFFTAVLFICDDFSKYWVHRWLHTVSFLWPFHRVHHSATALNFFTVFRTHPVEAILFSLRNALTQGFVIGLFFFLFGDQVSLMMILGANFFSFLFNVLGSNLRHSPVALPYPKWLERYLMSPAQHHIHHSFAIAHKDKNFGVVFSCWDRWFGSFCHSQKEEITYGLCGNTDEKEHKLIQLYIIPFVNSYRFILKGLKRV